MLFGSGGAAWPNSSDSFAYPAIDISADGKELHVAALNVTQTDVIYTKNVSIEGAAWQTAWTQAGGGTSPRYDVVSTSAYGTSAPSIALDENRRPHVVWTRRGARSPFAPNVFYARHDGAAWSGEAPLSTIDGGHRVPRGARPLDRHRERLGTRALQGRPNVGDATPKTDRFRYVRNTNQFLYSAYYAPVTIMQPAVAQNDFGQPGSVAAQGDDVWVTGSFLGAFSNVGYYNYSTSAGASWAIDGPGTESDVYECNGADTAPAPIGLNTEGTDHRLYGIRRSSGTIYAYKWGGAPGSMGWAAPALPTAATW